MQQRCSLPRAIATILAAGVAIITTSTALAQSDQRTIKLVYPFPAGSAGDTLSRIIAEGLRVHLKRTVVVENRTGAGGIVGVRSVVTAEPDGTTLLISPVAPVAIIPIQNAAAGYDAQQDLAAISHLVSQDLALAVGPALPVKSLKDLLDTVKAAPDKGTYGTPGAGSTLHLVGVKLATVTGLRLVPVHYRGTSLALNDVVAGQLPMLISALPDQTEQHKAGKVRIVATSGPKRSLFVAEVPTFSEQGVDISTVSWFAAYAPARTQQAFIDEASKAMAATVQEPQNVKRLADLGFEAVGTAPGEVVRMLRRDIAYWMPVIQAAGVKTQQ